MYGIFLGRPRIYYAEKKLKIVWVTIRSIWAGMPHILGSLSPSKNYFLSWDATASLDKSVMWLGLLWYRTWHCRPHSTVILREYFKKHSVEILQYCKNIYKAVGKVSKILQEPCNVRSKHYKCDVAAILIFHFNIAAMWELSSSFVWCFGK